ncbi:hypothetical protein GAO09_08535 [Rhizobiales bacterium RZME27]|uniref:Uncharacterized protein n=1 Tax=Endobacterium cereale TaxID=2663029 RepID=A0A6A8ABC4_9HYPH|nr:hypothetical protein [Endobacterium cereale]MQY46101.1 hypothetical protein [Endobacterium cereale]
MFQRIVDVIDVRDARISINPEGMRKIIFGVWTGEHHITDAFEYLDADFGMVDPEDRYLNQECPDDWPHDDEEFWKFALQAEISDEELGNDQIFECIPDMLFEKLEVELAYLKLADSYRYKLALLQSQASAGVRGDINVQRIADELSHLGQELEHHVEHVVDWVSDIADALGDVQHFATRPVIEPPKIDRSSFYGVECGPNNSHAKLAHLLDVCGLDLAKAAAITGSRRSTIASYRKRSSRRTVPPAIILDLENYFLRRMTDVARSAGYELTPRLAASL